MHSVEELVKSDFFDIKKKAALLKIFKLDHPEREREEFGYQLTGSNRVMRTENGILQINYSKYFGLLNLVLYKKSQDCSHSLIDLYNISKVTYSTRVVRAC